MYLFSELESIEGIDPIERFSVGVNMFSELEEEMDFRFAELPAPWFIYVFMGVGVGLCCVSCVGHIAAEAINGCCLCVYTLLIGVFILLEGALVAFFAIDRHWEKDIPFDPTGEVENFRSFVEENVDMCKWLGIALLMIQALSLLLALILRAMVSTRLVDSFIEEDYAMTRENISEPLLSPQPGQASRSLKDKVRGTLSDIWSARMRQKYASNNEYSSYRPLNQNSPLSPKSYA
ncbi:hypothetical protein Ancab_019780 [Ancistrocladus abbreviatus]